MRHWSSKFFNVKRKTRSQSLFHQTMPFTLDNVMIKLMTQDGMDHD